MHSGIVIKRPTSSLDRIKVMSLSRCVAWEYGRKTLARRSSVLSRAPYQGRRLRNDRRRIIERFLDHDLKLFAQQWAETDLHGCGIRQEGGIFEGGRKRRSQLRDSRRRQAGRRRERAADFFRLREQFENLALVVVMAEIDEPRYVGQVGRLVESGLQQDVDFPVAQPIGADDAKYRPRHAGGLDLAALHRQ